MHVYDEFMAEVHRRLLAVDDSEGAKDPDACLSRIGLEVMVEWEQTRPGDIDAVLLEGKRRDRRRLWTRVKRFFSLMGRESQ
jgi:hypothetical protein